jgi:hypothetical protein
MFGEFYQMYTELRKNENVWSYCWKYKTWPGILCNTNFHYRLENCTAKLSIEKKLADSDILGTYVFVDISSETLFKDDSHRTSSAQTDTGAHRPIPNRQIINQL